ncbi:MAG TPA: CHAT domain-containing tetratricopeptide repeat protein [Roseiflexaceae bacterium]|nr:CHAT domain-containing tetratricopeptide repeat protein [Roseiflexaceae bacterium]
MTHAAQSPGFLKTGRRIRTVAERYPRLAVRLARRFVEACQTEQHAASEAAYTLGYALLCWERPQEARIHLLAALEAAGEDGALRLPGRLALLEADLLQNPHTGLVPQLAELGAELWGSDMPWEAAQAWIHQANLLSTQGMLDQAAVLFDRLTPLVAEVPLLQGRLLVLRSGAAIRQANYAEATTLLDQADALFRALRLPTERARCVFRRAWILLRQEKVEDSLNEYLRAEQVFIRYDLPVRRAFCDKAIGLALSRVGKTDVALERLIRALRCFSALGHTAEIGACQLNLGVLAYETGQWTLALACFTRAELCSATAGARSDYLLAARNRAMVYTEQQRFDEARALLQTLEANAQAFGDRAEQAEIDGQIAALLAESGDLDGAEAHYRRAEARYCELDHTTDVAECVGEQGWLALRRSDYATAERLLLAAAPDLPQPFYWRVDHGLACCAVARNDLPEALRRYRTAHAVVAGMRRRTGSEHASSSLYSQALRMHSEALELAAETGALEDLLALSEYQRALTLRQLLEVRAAPSTDEAPAPEHLRSDLSALLSAQHPDGATLDALVADYAIRLLRVLRSAPEELEHPTLPDQPFDLPAFRQALDRRYGSDWTALVYIAIETRLLAVLVTSDQLTQVSIPQDALPELLKRACTPSYRTWTYLDLPFRQGKTAVQWNVLRQLADLLLPPALRTRLHPQHRLLIVPTGSLHLLPWAALRLDGGWLVEQAIVHTLSSLSVGLHLAKSSRPGEGAALLLGCGSFGDRADPLPFVGREIEQVAARCPGANILLDDAATADRLRHHLRSPYALLHIASHAQWFARAGHLAHIKLWDRDITLYEIALLKLEHTLVFLSACDGASASVLAGEELLGLSWAWLAAGAGGIVASLWQIHDGIAPILTDRFYTELGEHNDPGRALAQAQRALLRQAHSSDLHPPFFWSGMVLLGL